MIEGEFAFTSREKNVVLTQTRMTYNLVKKSILKVLYLFLSLTNSLRTPYILTVN